MRNSMMLGLMVALMAVSVVAQAEKAPERRFGFAKPVKLSAESEVYGAELKALPLVDLAKVVAAPAVWKGRTVQMRGTVASVCTKKGCWMMVGSTAQNVRVGFKDYGFFVPFDVAGRDVAVEGVIDVRVETEAERRHYAQDAKKSAEEIAAIKGDKTVISFIADAVQIGKLPTAPAEAKVEIAVGEKRAEGGPVCPDVKPAEGCGGCAKKVEGAKPVEGEKKADCGGCTKKVEGAKPAEGEKKADCGGCAKPVGGN